MGIWYRHLLRLQKLICIADLMKITSNQILNLPFSIDQVCVENVSKLNLDRYPIIYFCKNFVYAYVYGYVYGFFLCICTHIYVLVYVYIT